LGNESGSPGCRLDDEVSLGSKRRLGHQLLAQGEKLLPRNAIGRPRPATQDPASLRLTIVNALPAPGVNSKRTSSISLRIK
jgi:hypothetical protein